MSVEKMAEFSSVRSSRHTLSVEYIQLCTMSSTCSNMFTYIAHA